LQQTPGNFDAFIVSDQHGICALQLSVILKKNKKNLRNQKVSYTFVTDQLHKKQFYL